MKKILIVLLWLLVFPFFASAYQVHTSNDVVRKNTKNSDNLLVNYKVSTTKNMSWKKIKEIMNVVSVYLKNWDSAAKNWNYNLAIRNYQLAISELKSIRWTEALIKKIEKKIEEIRRNIPNYEKVDVKVPNKIKRLK